MSEPDDPTEPLIIRAAARRTPRYRSFLVAGALAGVVVGVVLALVAGPAGTAPQRHVGTAGVVIVVASALGVVGMLLGGALAVLRDRPRRLR